MERKNFKFELKSVDEEGSFEGIASAYRKKPDKVKDIVDPGAFTKTIQDNAGKTVITYPPHEINSIVGDGDIEDSTKGLLIRGKIIRDIKEGHDAYLLMQRGILKTLSIGYEVIKSEVVNGIRHLKEIKLYEVALVPGSFAADDQAIIHSFKALTFDEALTQQNAMNMLWKLLNTFEEVIMNIIRDEEETDKPAALKEAAQQFVDSFIVWVGSVDFKMINPCDVSGRLNTMANVPVIKQAIETLNSLLTAPGTIIKPDNTGDPNPEDAKSIGTSSEQKPSSDTLESEEAAKIDAVIAGLSNSIKAEEVGNKIDKIITKLKEN